MAHNPPYPTPPHPRTLKVAACSQRTLMVPTLDAASWLWRRKWQSFRVASDGFLGSQVSGDYMVLGTPQNSSRSDKKSKKKNGQVLINHQVNEPLVLVVYSRSPSRSKVDGTSPAWNPGSHVNGKERNVSTCCAEVAILTDPNPSSARWPYFTLTNHDPSIHSDMFFS